MPPRPPIGDLGRDTGRHPRHNKLGEGFLPRPYVVLVWDLGGGVRLADGRPQYERRRGIPVNRPSGGIVGDSYGYT